MKIIKKTLEFLNNRRYYLKYLIAALYAFLICIYPYPKGFDIIRFVDFYHTFQSEEMFGSHFWRILFQTPDFIAKIVIAFLAYTNLPLELFFISFTFTTVYFLFLFFEKYHLYHTHQLPQFSAYLLFTLCLPIGAILSGIRNIHAWSVVLLVFMEYYTTQRKNYGALFYAVAVHYAAFLFVPLLIFMDRFQKISFQKICLSALAVGLFLKLLILLDIKEWLYIYPEAVSLKLDFYLDKSEYLLEQLQTNLPRFIYRFFTLYIPLLYSFYFFFRKLYLGVNIFWFKLCLMYYSLFVFFPDILNRFCMLLDIIILSNFFIYIKNKPFLMKIWVFYILLFSFLRFFIFCYNVFLK